LCAATELKGYLKRTGSELSKNVTSWAGTAWSSFNSALKTRMGVEKDERAAAEPAALPIGECPLPYTMGVPSAMAYRCYALTCARCWGLDVHMPLC